MSEMFSVSRRVGRLVEARVFRLPELDDAKRYAAAFGPAVAGVEAPVLCADHRPVVIYSQPVANQLVETFIGLNKHWERVAILVAPSNATLAMQLQRIVRESNNASRRVFFDADEALAFLAERLDAAERVRLGAFLGEHPTSSRSRS